MKSLNSLTVGMAPAKRTNVFSSFDIYKHKRSGQQTDENCSIFIMRATFITGAGSTINTIMVKLLKMVMMLQHVWHRKKNT